MAPFDRPHASYTLAMAYMLYRFRDIQRRIKWRALVIEALKVTDSGTSPYIIYDFLSVCRCNYSSTGGHTSSPVISR